MARRRPVLWLLISLCEHGIAESAGGPEGRQAHLGAADDSMWADSVVHLQPHGVDHRRIMRLERRPAGEAPIEEGSEVVDVGSAEFIALANVTGLGIINGSGNVSVYGKISDKEILGYGSVNTSYGEAWDGTPTYDEAPTEEPPRKTIFVRLPPHHDDSAAVTLFALVFFTTTLLYLVKSRFETVRKSTWEGISQSLSIFVALTIFYLMKDVTDLIVYEKKKKMAGLTSKEQKSFLEIGVMGGGDPPSDAEVAVAFFRMIGTMLFLECMLWNIRTNHNSMTAWGLIGAHVVGFMAADAFGVMQESYPWNQTVVSATFILLLAAVYLVVLLHFLRRFRAHYIEHREEAATPEDVERMHAFAHQCIHSENESAAFCLGLLMTQAARYQICGYLPPAHGVQMNPHLDQINKLKVFALVNMVMIFFTFAIKSILASKFKDLPTTISRCLDVLCATFGSAMAWSLLFWTLWMFWFVTAGGGVLGKGNVMVGQLVLAIGWSWLGLVTTFFLQYCQEVILVDDRYKAAVDQFLVGLFMVIGLSWESCFLTAMYDIVDTRFSKKEHVAKAFARAEVAGCLCALLIPAWSYYIFPKSMTGQGHGHGGHGHGGHGGGHGEHGEEGHGHGEGEGAGAAPHDGQGVGVGAAAHGTA